MAIQSVTGSAKADSLTATKTVDSITTNLTKDFIIEGLAGNDTIKILDDASVFTIQGGDGADTILAEEDIDNVKMIQGGADNDTMTFSGTVTSSSIYGGKGADSLLYSGAVDSAVVAGSAGNDTLDFNAKVDKTKVLGNQDDDVITFAARLDTSSVYGGQGEDSILLSSTVDTSKIYSDKGDDTITVGAAGVLGKSTISAGEGEDSIIVTAGATGTSSLYGGKGEDSITLAGTSAIYVSGDKGDDLVSITGNSAGATVYGRDGEDTITETGTSTATTFFFGGDGADTITGGAGVNKIYGGKDADNIVGGANAAGADTLYGDAGADTITMAATFASKAFGGADDDSINVSGNSAGQTAHTVEGGAGADTIVVGDQTSQAANIGGAAVLNYSSTAEFITGGALVDSIQGFNTDIVKAQVGGALSITAATDFSRFAFSDGNIRSDNTEGLYIQTASGVTSASSVVLSNANASQVVGIDLSAGTTGASTIDATAYNALGIIAAGGAGNDTIKGGFGANSVNGGAGADTILGNAGVDTIFGGLGADTATGLGGADQFQADAGSLTITDFGFGGVDLVDIASGATLAATVTTDYVSTAAGDIDNAAAVNTSAVFTLNNDIDFDAAAATGTTRGIQITASGNAAASSIAGTDQVDSLIGGNGNDAFVYSIAAELFTTNAIVDNIDGSTGTGDFISLADKGAVAFTIATADSFGARITGVEAIKAAGDWDQVISVTLNNNAFDAGIATVDLALDTDATGLNIIDTRAETTATSDFALTGSAGVDSIFGGAGDDTIVGGAGADSIIGGGGLDAINVTAGDVDALFYSESGAANVDAVTNFDATADLIGLSIGNIDNGGVNQTISSIDGVDIGGAVAAGGFTPQAVAQNATQAAADGENLLILSTETADTFAAAIGTGEFTNGKIDGALGATEGVATAFYAATPGQGVFGYVLNTSTGGNGGVANQIDSADTFVEVARLTMTAGDFSSANMDSSLFAF